MHSSQDHIQEVWIMTRADDELTIELWKDGESIHVHCGNGESYTADRNDIVDSLIPAYQQTGWTLTTNYETA